MNIKQNILDAAAKSKWDWPPEVLECIAEIARIQFELALAERTEQCAKIAEQGIGMMVRLRDTKPSMSEAWKVDNEGITVKRIVASAIRALNQPEKR